MHVIIMIFVLIVIVCFEKVFSPLFYHASILLTTVALDIKR